MTSGKVNHYSNAAAINLGASAPGCAKRILVDDVNDGASIELLMIEIDPGGNSPHHIHSYELAAFVVEGHGKVLVGDAWQDLNPGDVVHVPGSIVHEFVNTGNTMLKFLSAIPAKRQIES
jgi:quercetin dioxygenase-like cupin family protein